MDDLVIIDSYEKGHDQEVIARCGHSCVICYENKEREETEKVMDKFTFEIESDYMVISDPCNTLTKTDPSRYIILAVGKGTWSISKIEREISAPFLRGRGSISSITLCKVGFMSELVMGPTDNPKHPKIIREAEIKEIGTVAADGTVVCCDLSLYRKDEGIEDHELWDEYDVGNELGDRFYSKMCNITSNEPDFGCYKGGCATSTKYDGIYKVYGKFSNNKIVGIRIKF